MNKIVFSSDSASDRNSPINVDEREKFLKERAQKGRKVNSDARETSRPQVSEMTSQSADVAEPMLTAETDVRV